MLKTSLFTVHLSTLQMQQFICNKQWIVTKQKKYVDKNKNVDTVEK